MSGQALLDRLQKQFGGKVVGANFQAIDPWIEVKPEGLVDVCRYLRDDAELKLEFLNCITAVDWLETDPKKAAKAAVKAD